MVSYRKFPQVDHAEASGELKAVYDDIQATLRAPWVAFACRVLATFPGYLPRAWQAAKPNFVTHYAERSADSIRRRAILPGQGPSALAPALQQLGWNDGDMARVNRALDALNYGNPKYLLLITAWAEAIQDRAAGGAKRSEEELAAIPYGLPSGVSPLQLVDPDTASAAVSALLKRGVDLHFHHGAATDYRVLANWPDFLQLALDTILAPVVRSETYDLTARSLMIHARELVHGFPSPAGIGRDALLDACTPTEIAGLTGLLFMYQRFIADVTIDMIRVKQALVGSEAAAASPYPVE